MNQTTINLSELAEHRLCNVRFTRAEVFKSRGSSKVVDLLPWEVPIMRHLHGANSVEVQDENHWKYHKFIPGVPQPGAEYHRLMKTFPDEIVLRVLGPETMGQPALEQLIRDNVRPVDEEGNEIMLNQPAPGLVDATASPARPEISEVDAAPAPDLDLPEALGADRNGYVKKDEAMLVLERLGIDVDNSMTADDVRSMLAETLDAEIVERGGEILADEKLPAKYARFLALVS